MNAFQKLEALNVEIAETGNYNAEMVRRFNEVKAAINAARGELQHGGLSRHYIDGIESAMYHALNR